CAAVERTCARACLCAGRARAVACGSFTATAHRTERVGRRTRTTGVCRGHDGARTDARRVAMTRTACVWCPDWPVIAARRRDESLRSVPVVVRERIGSRDLVRACSQEARANGVTRGMRRREAEALCPEAVCIDADEANEARTFEVVARAIEVFTPRVV